MEAVAEVRQLVVRHGQLAESCAVVQGFAEVSESVAFQHQGVQALDLLQACRFMRRLILEGDILPFLLVQYTADFKGLICKRS